jgi:hypothetical protein
LFCLGVQCSFVDVCWIVINDFYANYLFLDFLNKLKETNDENKGKGKKKQKLKRGKGQTKRKRGKGEQRNIRKGEKGNDERMKRGTKGKHYSTTI